MSDKYCSYGCGNKAIKILKNGKYCCSSHYSKCPALKQKNLDLLIQGRNPAG